MNFSLRKNTLLLLYVFVSSLPCVSQPIRLDLKQCIEIGRNNNKEILIARLEEKYRKEISRTSFAVPKTGFSYTQGQFNSIYKYDNNFQFSQVIPFPTFLLAQSQLNKVREKSAGFKVASVAAELDLKIKQAYYSYQNFLKEEELLLVEDSTYEFFLNSMDPASLLTNKGSLEKTGIDAQHYVIKNKLLEANQRINQMRIQLQILLKSGEEIELLAEENKILLPDTAGKNLKYHPLLLYLEQEINAGEKLKDQEKAAALPDITLGYFNQSIYGPANIFGYDYFLTTRDRMQGFQVQMAVPLFFRPYRSRVQAAKIQKEISQEYYNNTHNMLKEDYMLAVDEYIMTNKNLVYFIQFVRSNTADVAKRAMEAFHKKEIGLVEYLAYVSKQMEAERDYLHLVLQNNLAVAKIEYLLSGK